MWEDERNRRGGRWLITLSKQQRKADLDRFWLETLLCLVGEAFDDYSKDVCGAVINVRAKGDKIAIWTTDYENQEAVTHIGRMYKERLGVPPKVIIGYQSHADTATKSSSSNKDFRSRLEFILLLGRKKSFKMTIHQSLWLWLFFMVSGVCAQFRAFKRSSTVQEGDVRLAASRLSFGGRVEIFHAGQWGTVCDDGWDLDEAHVVCRQLKFPRALSVMTGGEGYYDKPASGPIWMDDMKCKGTEKYLHACTFKGWGITDCTHKEDVVIQCDAAGYMESAALSSYPLDHSINLSDELGEVFSDERFCDLSITAQSSLQDQEDTTLHDSTTLCAHKVIPVHT
uniref:SRCR domain-containing protein n=1 Tax=Knipowitschia caucasica TaxID=637954 RepID=A0AAV2KE53_KNICA